MKMFFKFLRKSVSFSNYFSCGVMVLVFFFNCFSLWTETFGLGWAGAGLSPSLARCHRSPPPAPPKCLLLVATTAPRDDEPCEAEGTRVRGRARWASRPRPRSAAALSSLLGVWT